MKNMLIDNITRLEWRWLMFDKKKDATTKKEQREIKKRLPQYNPNLKFIDDLHEKNSVKVDKLP